MKFTVATKIIINQFIHACMQSKLLVQVLETHFVLKLRGGRVVTRQQSQLVGAIYTPAGRVDAPADVIGQRLRYDRQLIYIVVSEHVTWQAGPVEIRKVGVGSDVSPADEQLVPHWYLFAFARWNIADESVEHLLVSGHLVQHVEREQHQEVQQVGKEQLGGWSWVEVKEPDIELLG